MEDKRKEQLTELFNSGYEAFKQRIPFSQRLLLGSGTTRTFWESGWLKAKAEADAAYAAAAPERRRIALEHRRRVLETYRNAEVDAMLNGRELSAFDRIRILLNAELGLPTTFSRM